MFAWSVLAVIVVLSGFELNKSHFVHSAAPDFSSSTGIVSSATGSISLLFVGDMFFDRYIRMKGRLHGEDYLFSCADPVFRKVDAVIGNLEGPITDEDSASEGTEIGSPENYQFTFPSTTAALLARHNIVAVDIGNNHIANFGNEGITATHKYLDAAHVGYFGGVVGNEPVYRTEIKGVPLSFVSYNAFYGTTSDAVAEAVAIEKAKGRTVIVFAHWGEEYSTSTELLRGRADKFAASGASLIVGAHPHVVLPSEIVDGVPVYYSLGNFMFDQYWNDSVAHGVALEVLIARDGLLLREHYADISRDGRTCVTQ